MSTVPTTRKAANDACRQLEQAIARLPCDAFHHPDDCRHEWTEPCKARNRLLALLGVVHAYVDGPKGCKP